MTQALNLALFANNLNTSGATTNSGLQNSSVTVTAGTGMSGGGAVALGSSITLTNAGVTSVTGAGTVSVSASTGSVTITGTGGSGTVTSVATGNGLSGGTITSTGTLTIAAPSFNSVGSYCWVSIYVGGATTFAAGASLAAGSSSGQVRNIYYTSGCCFANGENTLSGTWRVFNRAQGASSGSNLGITTIACRIS
jgi:hypothetical protein